MFGLARVLIDKGTDSFRKLLIIDEFQERPRGVIAVYWVAKANQGVRREVDALGVKWVYLIHIDANTGIFKSFLQNTRNIFCVESTCIINQQTFFMIILHDIISC